MNPRGVCAELALHFRRPVGRAETILDVTRQEPPLRVVRGFATADGASLAHLHNLSGGVLGGDQLKLAIHVGTGAQAQVTSTGATRIYRQREALGAAQQQTRMVVETGGLLEYLPDSLIPFAGARYQQSTQIELAEDAGLFYWEVIAPGREARGEVFQYDQLQLDLDICAADQPIALERMQIEPARHPLTSPLRLGDYRYFASFYVCRVGVAANLWLALEAELSEIARTLTQPAAILWGVSTLVAHGLVARAVAINGRSIQHGLLHFWQAAKQALYQRAAVSPRKIN